MRAILSGSRRRAGAALLGCALTLAGCAAGSPDDAQELSAAMHGCNLGNPVLLPGIALEREPDYVAEYVGGKLISDMGDACSGPQPESCEQALVAAEDVSSRAALRSLITV